MLGWSLLTLAILLVLLALSAHLRARRERVLWQRFELSGEVSLDEAELTARQRRLAQRLLRAGALERTKTGKLVPQTVGYGAHRRRRKLRLALLWLAALLLGTAGGWLARP